MQKNYNEAIPAYQLVYTTYSLPEFQAPALLQQAACDMAMKNWTSAKATLETLIGEFPDSKAAEQAKADLKTVKKNLPAGDPQ
jgi:TolA-binding protein